MSIVKRVVIELDLADHPFKENETLFSYARRMLVREGLPGTIMDVQSHVHIIEVSMVGGKPDTICTLQTVEIEVKTEAMYQ